MFEVASFHVLGLSINERMRSQGRNGVVRQAEKCQVKTPRF
jgi:hypothetical protein